MPNIKVSLDAQTGRGVFVDGEHIKGVRSVNYKACVDEIPIAELEIATYPDFEATIHRLYAKISPKTVKEAFGIIVEAIKSDDELRCAFIASIASALRENGKSEMPFQTEEYVASLILNRLVGD